MNQNQSVHRPSKRIIRSAAVAVSGLVLCGGLLVGCGSGNSTKSDSTDTTAVSKGMGAKPMGHK